MNHSVPYTSRLVETVTALGLVTMLAVGAGFLIADKNTMSIICFAIPAVILFVSYPRLCLYAFIFCIFVWRLLLRSPSILLIDAVAALLITGIVMSWLVRFKNTIKLPSIYKYYIALVLVLIVTAAFAYDHSYVVTPIIRVVMMLLMVVVLYNMIDRASIGRLVKFYFWLAVVHAAYNCVFFVAFGGSLRIFGFPGVYFDDLAMLAVPIGLAYFIWSERRRTSALYGLGTAMLFFGLIATQSRGPLLTAVWVGLALVMFSALKAGKHDIRFVRKRLKTLFMGTVLITGLLFLFSGLFALVSGRFEEMGEISHGTIWLRLSLWRASLLAFLQNPLTGIGPGNFRHVGTFFPSLRFDPARLYLVPMSAHNLVLHYLAETGVIGAGIVVALFFKHFRTSRKLFKSAAATAELAPATAMFGIGLAVFGTIFYMDGWMWGPNAYVASFFIAITAKLYAGRAARGLPSESIVTERNNIG